MREIWGRADDGTLARIDLPDDHSVTPGPWWPPLGLALHDPALDPDPDPALHLVADPSDPASLDRLESDLGLFVAERLDHLVAVHAAVLVRDGVMVIVPGESMVGKTTLCAAALAAGIQVWSDEYALVDPDTGLVTGWPRRLRVRTADGGANRVAISAVDPTVALVPALVARVRFDHALSVDTPLEVAPMLESETVLALLANTVCGQSRPEFAFRGALAVASHAAGVTGTRGDATAALHALFDLAANQHLPRSGRDG